MYRLFILAVAVALISPNSFAFECRGTQPNWNASLDSEVAKIVSPQKTTTTQIIEVEGVAGYSEEYLQIYSNKGGAVAIANRTDNCTDGVSKNVYPFEVVFVGEQKLYGCCGDPIKE